MLRHLLGLRSQRSQQALQQVSTLQCAINILFRHLSCA